MIALSNEEIAIVTKAGFFERWNFINNTLLNQFYFLMFKTVHKLFIIPNQRILGIHFEDSIYIYVDI